MYRIKIKLFSLKRIRYAGLELGNLKEREYRQLSKNEIKKLWNESKEF